MDATKEILKEGGKFTLFLQLHYVIYLLYRNKNSVESDNFVIMADYQL